MNRDRMTDEHVELTGSNSAFFLTVIWNVMKIPSDFKNVVVTKSFLCYFPLFTKFYAYLIGIANFV